MRTPRSRSIRIVTLGVAGLAVLAGCGDDASDGPSNTDVELANPAAVFCAEQGGTTSGPEPMCELPNGTVVDAWEYFRAEWSSTDAP